MENKKQDQMIVLVENYWEGYFQSVIWIITLGAGIGFAVWIDSTAMQWVMGILWFLVVLGWAANGLKSKRFTPEDAIKRIEEIKSR